MMEIAAGIGLLIVSIVIHEFSHGIVAYWLGDDTAKRAGRLTLNPIRHLDPFWTVIFPILLFVSTGGRFVFAMARPVPVDFSRLHEPKKDMGFVGAAGPFSNLVLASILSWAWRYQPSELLLLGFYLNIGLTVFNMVPVPPLDGSRVMASILPWKLARSYLRLEPIGYLVLLGLYFSGFLTRIMLPAVDALCRIFNMPVLSL